MYRLTAANNPQNADERYTYDKLGNRITSQRALPFAGELPNGEVTELV